MTLDDFIAKYNGKVVADGQCGNLVRAYWNEVDHTTPPSYPNSKDYWFNPVPGYDKVQDPQPGDIAIYNGHGAYPEGHSAIYYDGRVFEQNADPDGSPAHLFKRNSPYLLGYLRKQGGSPKGEEIMNKGDVFNLFFNLEHRTPSQADYDAWVGQPIKKYLDERGFNAVKETQLNPGDVQNIYYHLGRDKPDQEAIDFWTGHSGKELFYAIINSQEYKDKHK